MISPLFVVSGLRQVEAFAECHAVSRLGAPDSAASPNVLIAYSALAMAYN